MFRSSESSSNELPELITANEFCSLLKISKRHFQRLLSTGKIIPPIRLGRSTRWDKQEVNKWIKNQNRIQDQA